VQPLLAKYSFPADGCAILYRTSALSLISSHAFTYAFPTDGGADDALQIQNQVALLNLFEHRRSGEKFVVATTHLKADKSAEGERARKAEASQLLHEASKFRAAAATALNMDPDNIPCIVCGDFNATPHPSKLQGYPPLVLPEVMSHPMGLSSAYPIDCEEGWTTWKVRKTNEGGTKESKHIIDYIFFTGSLRSSAFLQLPSDANVGEAKFPSKIYPSDHCALAASFEFCTRSLS
jgi:endonuclease/exonuclease/phosphatase family metal-dependent hydrolase